MKNIFPDELIPNRNENQWAILPLSQKSALKAAILKNHVSDIKL